MYPVYENGRSARVVVKAAMSKANEGAPGHPAEDRV